MSDFWSHSLFFGSIITIAFYLLGAKLKERLHSPLFNPLLTGVALTICFLLVFDIDYKVYSQSAHCIGYLVTPATICLAMPLYQQIASLKKNFKAILAGVLTSVLTSMLAIWALAIAFCLDHKTYVTLLPKSITTAIGMDVAEILGGYTSIAVAVIITTGIIGNMTGEFICKLLKIKEPIARGIALGCASHAMGTAKAMEMGIVEGAMGSLAIVAAGIITVFIAPIFALLK